ncbi:MAG: DUF86 domain-containing protein [Acidobacteria bacterium]|nr:DUF86 domain-containing protein [Acidobacteriota bacterium]MBI3658762.1 DUF86 domain-containing protein [Acidobacteriota bacterium]
MKPDETVYLQHILDAITKVEFYLEDINESAFKQNTLIQDGVIRQDEIIGDATKRLSNKLLAQYAHIPWEDISGMRDKLIHDYFGVDIETVWLTATEDLPTLKAEVTKILTESSS